jgi:hypothetical protein
MKLSDHVLLPIVQNKNLNELLTTGCNWLQEYLSTRPQEKEKLKVCQDYPKSK